MSKGGGMPAQAVAVMLCVLLLAACGGGGGSNQVPASLVVTAATINVTATTADAAPAAQLNTYVSTDVNSTTAYYITGHFTKQGIASISGTGDASAANFTVQFQSPASLGPGTYEDTITIEGCTDNACTTQIQNSPQTVAVTYTVTAAAATLTSVSPTSISAGGAAFTLTATGTGFTTASVVQWNGSALTTTFVSSTQVTATVPAADIASMGTASITVTSSAGANGLVSNAISFTILAPPPPMALTSIAPSTVASGGTAFVLNAIGVSFSSSAVILWNGTALPTTFVSSTQLQAQVPAGDIAAVGSAAIAVQNSTAAGGTSSALTLTIKAQTPDAVALQITPGHSGAMTFKSLSFPTSATWTADVGGAASYALIADGKVFVTVAVNGTSQLIALDQATGSTVWGPIQLNGSANAAYDGGQVFVVSGVFGTSALMQAYDSATGALNWSTLLSGQYAFSSGPTALNGMVYTGGAGDGGTLYALSEASGAIVWTEEVANGDDSTPAVTNEGVYVSYPCSSYAFVPATGSSIFSNNTGCDGGGGATPVVANNVLYSPNSEGGTYSGTTFNATTGAVLGSYAADVPPAIGTQMGFFLQSGTLRGLTLSNNTVMWSFTGDGSLVSSPILVNQDVIIGSSLGNVYAINASTGAQDWTVATGAAIPAGAHWGAGMPLSGLAAGDGLLVVPAGVLVIAYTLSTNP